MFNFSAEITRFPRGFLGQGQLLLWLWNVFGYVKSARPAKQ
jgi:hypothetical protein